MLKCHADMTEQFLNSIIMESTEITTVLCYVLVLGKLFLIISNNQKNA